MPISVEETLWEVGARGDTHSEFGRQTIGQSLRHARSTADTTRVEAIEVALVGLQARRVYLDGVVLVCRDSRLT